MIKKEANKNKKTKKTYPKNIKKFGIIIKLYGQHKNKQIKKGKNIANKNQ